jgi:peptidyl-prolyl cis-trans isomerase SurA
MKRINPGRIVIILLLAIFYSATTVAQDKIIDQVVAVVGGNIILKSEIEEMHMNQQAQGITSEGDMKCEIFENMLIDKLLVAEAELDTLIEVTPSQVNQQMDAHYNRISLISDRNRP